MFLWNVNLCMYASVCICCRQNDFFTIPHLSLSIDMITILLLNKVYTPIHLSQSCFVFSLVMYNLFTLHWSKIVFTQFSVLFSVYDNRVWCGVEWRMVFLLGKLIDNSSFPIKTEPHKKPCVFEFSTTTHQNPFSIIVNKRLISCPGLSFNILNIKRNSKKSLPSSTLHLSVYTLNLRSNLNWMNKKLFHPRV